ncbi:MAG: penicillin-binding protein activator [Deltaproteobacteria bacterium]|nr:penicillin-binding protein activator [Deltaproteobacteria bacterium]
MILRFLLIFTILMAPLSTLQAAEAVSIGAVLPLSGKFAAFGNKALQGVELALEKHNSTEAGTKRPVRLLIKDSKGMPKTAEKAVNELNTDGVDVIIGPILATTADAAAKKAQELKIPIITMTQKEGITGIGGWVFRNGMTNAAQVKGLVDYASRRGVEKVAVLYPDNPFGRELTAVFTAEIVKRGGEVVASEGYKEGQTDFGTEIKALVGPEFLEKMRAYTEEKEKEFKEAEKSKAMPTPTSESEIEPVEEMERPMPDFDAVFIPDYADRVGLIVPQLAFYDVRDVRLLGISGWNSPKLINMAGDFLSDDVMIVDGFFSGSSRPQVVDFVGAYRKIFGEEPGIVEALAYDTMGIVLSLIPVGGDSRGGIKNTILKIKDYHGVSGIITFSGSDAERSFYYLTVNRGVIEEITDH